MAIDVNGIVSWLKGWFYDKDEVTTYLNAKANKNQSNANYDVVTDSSGNITTEPKINVASGSGLSLDSSTKALSHSNSITAQTSAVFKKFKYDAQGHITGTANVSSSDLPSHTHSATDVTDSNAHSNINTSANATQSAINTAIDTAIGNLSSIRAIEIVSTLPTASSSTMGKLYIISENSKINVYYTIESSGSYSWHKMDADILDELTVNWSDIQNKPSSFTPASHTHGNIENDGTITTTIADPYGILVVDDDDVIGVTSGISPIRVAPTGQYSGNTSISDDIGSIVTALSGKAPSSHTHSQYVTSIALVPKSSDNTGAVKLYYGDEPSS